MKRIDRISTAVAKRNKEFTMKYRPTPMESLYRELRKVEKVEKTEKTNFPHWLLTRSGSE